MQRPSPSSLLTIDWWRDAVSGAWLSAGRCRVAAVLLTLANIAMVVGVNYVYGEIGAGTASTDRLIQVALVGLGSCIAGIVLTMWALGAWLLRLTAYARAACLADGTPSPDAFDQAIAEVGRRRGYLAKFWLVASIYLVIPSVPLLVLSTFRVLASSPAAGWDLLSVSLPPWLSACLDTTLAVLAVLVTGYSLVALAVSSVSAQGAAAAATEALTLSARNWRGVLLCGGAVLLLNGLVSIPATIGGALSFSGAARLPVWIDVISQIWFGFAATVCWPLSVRPFCRLLRGQIK